jgi:subtilisin family serine protease
MLVVTPSAGASAAVEGAFHVAGVSEIYSNSGNTLWTAQNGSVQKRPSITNEPTWGVEGRATDAPVGAPYGVDLIGAPGAWKQNADGHGLVYGNIDTGVDFRHQELQGNYRGTRADGTFDHDYNWMDFEGTSAEPIDARGHGTHTMGTAVGATVGVAPGAKWISTRALSGTADAALRALQWMQAPTRRDGSSADPTKAPDVVGISWWLGKPEENLFRESMRNLSAAGIEVVKSAGNQGPDAKSVTSPGQYPEVIAVAAVDKKGAVADFSSRGPARWPKGSTTPKPDFAAAGVDVVSSLPRNRYGAYSGTSMAQPHASGAILDILSKYPELSHAELRAALADGAVDKGRPGWDAEYGAGLINIPAALAAAAERNRQHHAA